MLLLSYLAHTIFVFMELSYIFSRWLVRLRDLKFFLVVTMTSIGKNQENSSPWNLFPRVVVVFSHNVF